MRRSHKLLVAAFLLTILIQGCAEIPKKAEAPPPPPPPPAADGKPWEATHIGFARTYEQQGAIREALEQWKAVQSLDPASREAAAAVVRLEKESREKADEAFRRGQEAWRRGLAEESRRCFLLTLYLDPDRKEALEKLRADPPRPKGVLVHKVAPGDTLSIIAQKYYGITKDFQQIAQYNMLNDPSKLKVGQELLIPEVTSPEAQKETPPQERVVRNEDFRSTPAGESPNGAAGKAPEGLNQPVNEDDFMEASQKTSVRVEELYYLQGVGFYGERDYESAAVEFKKVVNADPNYKNALAYYKDSRYHFGRELIAKGELDKAYDVFKELSDLDPYYQDVNRFLMVAEDKLKEQHYMRGIQLYNQERLEEALNEWRVVAKVDPQYKKVTYYIERCEQILKKIKELKSSGS